MISTYWLRQRNRQENIWLEAVSGEENTAVLVQQYSVLFCTTAAVLLYSSPLSPKTADQLRKMPAISSHVVLNYS